ncbi:MAG: hypothetical protein WEC73_03295 [Chthoniobacterales bacterium]
MNPPTSVQTAPAVPWRAWGVATEMFLAKRGFWLLAAFAVVYYALYVNTGLKLTGEQGSNALIAMRILGGERPIADMFIGYNLMWFYPLVWIFDVLGPNWLAMRIYFFVLAGVTGLMGYALVQRVTGQAWLALITGLFMVLMPGAIFRNYLGFLGVLAATVLLRGYVLDAGGARRQIAWMAVAGAGMSLCFLIRIEPSLLIAVVWIGLVVLYPFGAHGEFGTRLRTVMIGTLLGLVTFAAVHAPFVIHAYQRGFGPQFVGQYSTYAHMLQSELEREVDHWTKAPPAPPAVTPAPAEETARAPMVQEVGDEESAAEVGGRDGRRALPAPSRIIGPRGIYFFAAGLWFPVLLAPVLVLTGAVLLLFALAKFDAPAKRLSLIILATTGCALSLFPQYFFFRPDSTHLTEFLLVFWPASACSAWAVWETARRYPSRGTAIWCWFVAALVALQMLVTFNALFSRESSGSIRAGRGMDTPFQALNGVRAKVKAKEFADWEGLRDSVLAHSAPGDFVITYPYVPIVNVMCDRPTYQWSLYIDNATASPKFFKAEEAHLAERRPAVIVINNRAINRSEVSRFHNWAAPLHAVIARDYELVGEFFERIEVYARPDKAAAARGTGID